MREHTHRTTYVSRFCFIPPLFFFMSGYSQQRDFCVWFTWRWLPRQPYAWRGIAIAWMCMYVCIHVYVCVCIYVCVVCVCMYTCMCVYVCMCVCVVYMYILCMYVLMYVYVCMYVYVYMYISVCMYVCMYVCICMYVFMCVCACVHVCIYAWCTNTAWLWHFPCQFLILDETDNIRVLYLYLAYLLHRAHVKPTVKPGM